MPVNFDLYVHSLFLSFRTPELNQFFIFLTHLGDTPAVIFPALAIVALLLRDKKHQYALVLLVAIVGSRLTTWGLKILIARPRPEESFSLLTEASFSFPSGHATGAAALYGFLIYFIWKTVKNKSLRFFLSAVFALVIIGVVVSRLYLGVHYASDVVAGLIVAGIWIAVGIRLSKK